ncbi:hypothetical protein PMAYCL1PPCAC_18949, partial [Pristionchus mayeri]
FGTHAIHAGHDSEHGEVNPLVAPLSVSATYKLEAVGKPANYLYSRFGNPTRDALQANLAALEDAKYCATFGSGTAAITSVVGLLKTGDHIICADAVFGGTHSMLTEVAPRNGLEVTFIDITRKEEIEGACKRNTKMIWFESPSNPVLTVVDIQGVVDVIRKANPAVIVVVDNTFMTPYFQRPLSFGADVVVHSLSKYINGHSDIIMGCAMTNREDIRDRLFYQQTALGAVPSPYDCSQVIRSIKTLHLRMKAHYENALAIAQWLEKNSLVEKVLYPALPSHPQHELHKKQTKGMSGVIAFYLKGGLEESLRFFDAIKVITLAESLGGVESLASLPARMSSHKGMPREELERMGITDNLIRLSVGCEEKEDLIADLDQAIKKACLSH